MSKLYKYLIQIKEIGTDKVLTKEIVEVDGYISALYNAKIMRSKYENCYSTLDRL